MTGEEQCDDGERNGDYAACRDDCQGLGPHCGDGELSDGEVCDDGNAEDADGCNVDCQPSGELRWSYTGTRRQGSIRGVSGDDDGVIMAVGSSGDSGLILGFAPNGDVILDNLSSLGGDARHTALERDGEGTFWAFSFASHGAWIRRMNPTWSADTVFPELVQFIQADIGPSGIAASTYSGVAALDNEARLLWHVDYWHAADVAFDPSGDVWVLGLPDLDSTFGLYRHDASGNFVGDGIELTAFQFGYALVAYDGGVAVAGEVDDNALLTRYDAQLEEVWSFGIPAGIWSAIDVASNGDIVVAGPAEPWPRVARYSPAGALRWSASVELEPPLDVAEFDAVAVAPDGTIVAGGLAADTEESVPLVYPLVATFTP